MDDHIHIKTIVLLSGTPGTTTTQVSQEGKSRLRERLLLVRELWAKLHKGLVTNEAELAEWELLIPQYGCSCKSFYFEWKLANPPDFSSPENLFAWGVRLHNAVNAKLGKPQITLEEAYSIWRNEGTLC
ncbi:MAG: ERV1/ALR-related protein [Bacteroidota bacterium]|jgi:hypothetical protein